MTLNLNPMASVNSPPPALSMCISCRRPWQSRFHGWVQEFGLWAFLTYTADERDERTPKPLPHHTTSLKKQASKTLNTLEEAQRPGPKSKQGQFHSVAPELAESRSEQSEGCGTT